jgi:hypothetical protein
MKEGRPRPVPVLRQPHLESVALHADDDRAKAGPRVEPGVKNHQFTDRAPVPEEYEAQSGDQD